jgi:hypothetical protein
MENDPAATPPDATPTTPRETPSRSPFVRLAFCVIFVLTLPFTWGATSSCSGLTKTYTGFEQATKNPGNTITLSIIYVIPVVLGFVQYYMRPPWMRAMAELISAMLSGFGTFFCFISTIFAGALSNRGDRFFPAPLIATIATFMMTVHAFRGAVERVMETFAMRSKEPRS